MKFDSYIFFLGIVALSLTSCGQRTSESRVSANRYSNVTSTNSSSSDSSRRGIGTVLRSGTTGSPTNANNSGTGQAAQSASSVPAASNASVAPNVFNQNANAFSGVDFWGNLVQNTATDPQQCADLYNKYQRFPGNFESAFSVLGACLNRVMIVKNPNLFQGYMQLSQQQYGYY